ncbi:transglutaminase-like domain-containing protein, partial [Klebsiella pneumoniae]
PNLSLKQSADFVDSFLFEIQEGYCDYFSTALVMMARSLDIPARWVKGYAPGQAAFGEDMALSQATGNTPTLSYT